MISPDLSSHHEVKLDRWFRFFRHFVNDIIRHISSPSSIAFIPCEYSRSAPPGIRRQLYAAHQFAFELSLILFLHIFWTS